MIQEKKRKIIITGSCGFIGTHLTAALEAAGFDVWGIDADPKGRPQVIRANFLDPEQTKSAFRQIGCCAGGTGHYDTVIHLTALSTGTKPPEGYTLETVNVEITKNILAAIDNVEQFVYFSTTTVYGEEGRKGFVSPREELRPASLYGIGKKRCEEMIREKNFRSLAICRPTPVYDEHRMRNMQVRAYFPFTRMKIRLIPSPSYSLCHVRTIVENVTKIVEEVKPGVSIRNLADAKPYTQNHIAKQFPGFNLPLPSCLFLPFYFALKLIPGKKSYQLRCMYRKLFCSCLYSNEVVDTPGHK